MVSSRRELDELSGNSQIIMSARAAEYTISKDADLKKKDAANFKRIESKI